MRQIIIEKSIQKKSLIFKLDTALVFDYIMMYFMSWVLPFTSILVVISDHQHNRAPSPVAYSIFTVIDIWLLLSLYFTNKLFVVSGNTLDENKQVVTEVLEQMYPKFEFFSTGKSNLILFGKNVNSWNRGKLITVILNENKIYINKLSTYRGGGFSSINGLSNYIRSRNIAKNFTYNLSTDY